jgi:hypothetical protein
VGAPGIEERRIPATRAAEALPSGDLRVLVVGGRRGRRERWGAGPPERWEPAPPSPRVAEEAEERVPGAGAGVPATRRSTEGPVRAAEAFGSAAVVASAATVASAEPSRKRKRGFST